MVDKYNELASTIFDAWVRLLVDKGLSEEEAEKLSEEAVDCILDTFSGENIYIPRNISARAAARNRKIYDEFTGYNHDELARKYQITRQRLYGIIRQVRGQILAEKQADLFGTPGQ